MVVIGKDYTRDTIQRETAMLATIGGVKGFWSWQIPAVLAALLVGFFLTVWLLRYGARRVAQLSDVPFGRCCLAILMS